MFIFFLNLSIGYIVKSNVEKIDYSDLHSNMKKFRDCREEIISEDRMTKADAEEINTYLRNSLKILVEHTKNERESSEEHRKMNELTRIFRTAKGYVETRTREGNILELKIAIEAEDRPRIINPGAFSLYQLWRAFRDVTCDYEESRSGIQRLTIFVLAKSLSSYKDFYRWIPNGFVSSIGEINDELCERSLEQLRFHEKNLVWIYDFSSVGLAHFKGRQDDVRREKRFSPEKEHLALIEPSALQMKGEFAFALDLLEENCRIIYVGEEHHPSGSVSGLKKINNEKNFTTLLYYMYQKANSPRMSQSAITAYMKYMGRGLRHGKL